MKIKKKLISNIITGVLVVFAAAMFIFPSFKGSVMQGLMKIGLFQPRIPAQTEQENLHSFASWTDGGTITFRNAEDVIVDLANLKGKVVFINFWATWCAPCIAEMPTIQKLYTTLENNPNVVFLMVDVDNNRKKSQEFMDKRKFNLPVYTPVSQIPSSFMGNSIPTTVVLDKSGNIAFRHEGMGDFSNAEFVAFMTELAGGNTTADVSQKLQELERIQEEVDQEFAVLKREFESRIENGEDISKVQDDLMEKQTQFIANAGQKIYAFADANRDNLAGYHAFVFLFSVDLEGYEQEIIAYGEEAMQLFGDEPSVQAFADHLMQLKPLSIGAIAPDFASRTPDGQTVRLSDLRGQYVLLDFWAAWCTPCRVENPNIVEQYHAYKDKGFTVFGVSLDRSREAWLQAIEKDKLTWTQVSELNQWDSEAGRLYNISSIPASFMISPEGVIIAKNLRGPALGQFLSKNL